MAEWAAGERLTASKLSTTHRQVAAAGLLTPTDTYQDIPGASIAFTTTRPNVIVRATAVADCEGVPGTTNSGVIIVVVDLDGVNQGPQQCLYSADADIPRATVTQTWIATVSQGPHVMKLEARRSGGIADQIRINSIHTTLTLMIEDNV